MIVEDIVHLGLIWGLELIVAWAEVALVSDGALARVFGVRNAIAGLICGHFGLICNLFADSTAKCSALIG